MGRIMNNFYIILKNTIIVTRCSKVEKSPFVFSRASQIGIVIDLNSKNL